MNLSIFLLLLMNLLIVFLLLRCQQPLSWRRTEDRTALIGFSFMLITLTGDIIALAIHAF